MGLNLKSRHEWEQSIAFFVRALARADEAGSIGLRSNLAVVLLDKGDVEGAVALFRENVRLRPRAVRTHFSLGIGLIQLGKFAEAVESFRT